MSYVIVPTKEPHFPELYQVIDAVAREQRFLAFTQAPPWESSRAFYMGLLAEDAPYFVALADSKVVGWCDVLSLMGESRSHIGALGMGLLTEYRRQGLGTRLLQAAIEKSWQKGLTRLELTVRDDNLNAKALYEKFGFEVEGLRRKGSVIGDEVRDVWSMALLR